MRGGTLPSLLMVVEAAPVLGQVGTPLMDLMLEPPGHAERESLLGLLQIGLSLLEPLLGLLKHSLGSGLGLLQSGAGGLSAGARLHGLPGGLLGGGTGLQCLMSGLLGLSASR